MSVSNEQTQRLLDQFKDNKLGSCLQFQTFLCTFSPFQIATFAQKLKWEIPGFKVLALQQFIFYCLPFIHSCSLYAKEKVGPGKIYKII